MSGTMCSRKSRAAFRSIRSVPKISPRRRCACYSGPPIRGMRPTIRRRIRTSSARERQTMKKGGVHLAVEYGYGWPGSGGGGADAPLMLPTIVGWMVQ